MLNFKKLNAAKKKGGVAAFWLLIVSLILPASTVIAVPMTPQQANPESNTPAVSPTKNTKDSEKASPESANNSQSLAPDDALSPATQDEEIDLTNTIFDDKGNKVPDGNPKTDLPPVKKLPLIIYTGPLPVKDPPPVVAKEPKPYVWQGPIKLPKPQKIWYVQDPETLNNKR